MVSAVAFHGYGLWVRLRSDTTDSVQLVRKNMASPGIGEGGGEKGDPI